MSTQVAADADAASGADADPGWPAGASPAAGPAAADLAAGSWATGTSATHSSAASEPDKQQISVALTHISWWRSALIGLATWAAAAGTYIVVTLLSWMINDKSGPLLERVYLYWNHWDTGHYIRISQVGYTSDRPDTHAFFPLFPILLRGFNAIIPGPPLVASLVLSNLACIGALVVLHRFALREFDLVTADRMLLFLMAWPTAFFLSAGYNESLFLLLSAAALYCMRAGNWWAAGALGALASATRLSGALLAIAFAAEYVRQRGWRPRHLDAAAILLMPLGLVADCVFCWVSMDDPLAFSHAQGEWGRELAAPWTGVLQAVDAVSSYPSLRQVAIHNVIDLTATLVTAGLLVACLVGPWRSRHQLSLILYSVASFLAVLTGPVAGDFPLQGAPRYVLEFIPIFFLLARLGASRAFERIYLLPAIGLQAVFLLTFINNVWVA